MTELAIQAYTSQSKAGPPVEAIRLRREKSGWTYVVHVTHTELDIFLRSRTMASSDNVEIALFPPQQRG